MSLRSLRLASALPLVLMLAASPVYAAGQNYVAGPTGTIPADPSSAPSRGDVPPAAKADSSPPPSAASPAPESPAGLAGPASPPPLDVSKLGGPLSDDEVGFTANSLDYDYDKHIVTASGDVRMVRQGNRLRADTVVWNRDTGQVHATGNVALANPQGDMSYSQDAELTDSMKDGVAQDLLLVLENGGRMAAETGSRKDGVYTLTRGAYTPCDVTKSNNCPKEPIWKITAAKVVYDPSRHRISYRDARLTFLSVPILWLPAFSHPDGSGKGGNSGLLVPFASYTSRNGLEVDTPYYIQLAPNRDLTITPHAYTAILPMMEAQYRVLGPKGAYQIHGYLTDSSQSTTNTDKGSKSVRGYIDANGKWQLDPFWSITASIRAVTDKTFLRRYDISQDDRLRSVAKAERIDDNSYLSIAAWEFQSLNAGQKSDQQPLAIPAVDYRRTIADPWLGGTFTVQGNTLALTRIAGQDTQRAFAGAQWDKWFLTPLGQQITLTAYGRGDIYHSDQNSQTATSIYQGTPGWQGRFVSAFAVDMRWPFVGEFLDGTQRITPRVQVVASPHTRNLAIPDEDSRAVDLEDTNLFSINRFPGYDRWEDGTRITYGVEYDFDRPRLAFRSLFGQSYRFGNRSTIFPDGTGLSSKTSDFVGRASIRYGNFVTLTERFRLDKDTLAVRRNEIDATVGSATTYLEAGYLSLNRHISQAIEDLRDHQEVRLGARLAIGKRWSLFGSTTIDLTDDDNAHLITNVEADDASGFDPVQSRVGIAYEDDCFDFSVQWRRDFTAVGDAQRGNTVQFQLALKNLGR